MRPLYNKHQDDIITGEFSKGMMADRGQRRQRTCSSGGPETARLREDRGLDEHPEQEYFDNAVLMVAMVRLAWSWPTGHERGHRASSRPTTSPRTRPLIANTIARKKLYEMNQVFSDNAE
jgi:ketol-acid reductoisomerase